MQFQSLRNDRESQPFSSAEVNRGDRTARFQLYVANSATYRDRRDGPPDLHPVHWLQVWPAFPSRVATSSEPPKSPDAAWKSPRGIFEGRCETTIETHLENACSIPCVEYIYCNEV